MKVIKPYYEILTPFSEGGLTELMDIERVARTCYQSEPRLPDESKGETAEDVTKKFITGLIDRGHEAMLEHQSITVKFVCDRGVSHELVRHRVASFAQESTRYCNYSKDDFGGEITFILPFFLNYGTPGFKVWKEQMKSAEKAYFDMLDIGHTPQEARSVLPNSLKTEVNMTCNLREWRWFFKLRAAGITGTPHPQMLEVAVPLLQDMKKLIPVIFDDIWVCKQGEVFLKEEGEQDVE